MAKQRKTAKASRLARVGDPYVLPSGEVLQPIPAGGVVVPVQDVGKKVHGYKSTKRRNIGDFVADPAVLNGIVCVLLYSVLGIGDREIADALKISSGQVKEVRQHPSYADVFDAIKDELINVNSDLVQSRIAAYGVDAVQQAANVLLTSKNDGLRLRAAEDFVGWGGHSKGNGTKQPSMGVDALRIVVTDGDKKTEVSVGVSLPD